MGLFTKHSQLVTVTLAYSPAPLRRSGQTSLILIPTEIYLAIFEYITPTGQPLTEEHVKTFSALALVCRFFCSIALPRVFEHVAFSGNTNDKRAQASRKTVWAKQIIADTEPAKSVASYVKECTFVSWDLRQEVQWVLIPFAKLYCQAMARMPNIRKVVFYMSFVNKHHWEAMAELKQLEVLEFRFCSFVEDPPDQELSARTVILLSADAVTTSTLRPIATSALRTLETDNVETALKLVTFHRIAIENLVFHNRVYNMEPLLDVFQHLPSLESVTFGLTKQAAASPLISALSLKKLFTRLRSLTVKGAGFIMSRQDMEMLVSALCDGPGILPSLEELNFLFFTEGGAHGSIATLDVVSDRLNGTIIPAFPNLRCIRALGGFISLEEGDWKIHYLEEPEIIWESLGRW
ncbi:uncharacterized protein EDB91DRAFT_1253721 [Suillus paluster]|uniref:uncharacterized protein n=1 Tax=Suillus paluster TaxID=48578 RepID=UPI001B85F713|nr:uncharacterized protein EDB91DRAFT_1253721 [Suillus paluster]KAG1727748.1 hypothetical protein EDB91DRAFT_1253721 [Suillus paluster]